MRAIVVCPKSPIVQCQSFAATMNLVRKSNQGFKCFSLVQRLVVFLSFTHSTIAYALPAEEAQTDSESYHPNITYEYPAGVEWPPDTIQYRWDPSGTRLKSKTDLYIAALQCGHLFALQPLGTRIATPFACQREGFESVVITVEGVEPSKRPDYMISNHIVFAIYLAITEIVRKEKFMRLAVTLSDKGVSLGSVIIVNKSTFLEGAKNGVETVTSVEDVTARREHNITAPSEAVTVREDGAAPEGHVDMGASPLGPPVCDVPRLPLATGQADGDVLYRYKIKPTQEKGLTLIAYVMAAFQYFLLIAFNPGDPRDFAIPSGGIKTSPVYPLKPLPGFDVILRAGYVDGKGPEAQCPPFTAYDLIVAMAEVGAELQLSKKFDFFDARILPGSTSETPLGHLWMEKGVSSPGPDGLLTTF